MKLQPDSTKGPTLTGYGEGWVAVNGEKVVTSLLISSMGHRMQWHNGSFEELSEASFAPILGWGAELVLLGSGAQLHFPKPQWLAQLYARRIGVETMDTQAACRTYNFLASEGRKVVAALIL